MFVHNTLIKKVEIKGTLCNFLPYHIVLIQKLNIKEKTKCSISDAPKFGQLKICLYYMFWGKKKKKIK